MIDRTFGGRGETPSPLPEALPPSALLLIARLAGLIADRLSLIMGGEGTVLAQRHGADLAELYPFTPAADLVIADFAVTEGMRAPWLFQLALPAATAANLGTGPTQARPTNSQHAAHRPDREPFGSVPVSLDRHHRRHAPAAQRDCRTGSRRGPAGRGGPASAAADRRAHHRAGTVGSQDDRVALQLTALV